jgi:hypothetical protein
MEWVGWEKLDSLGFEKTVPENFGPGNSVVSVENNLNSGLGSSHTHHLDCNFPDIGRITSNLVVRSDKLCRTDRLR